MPATDQMSRAEIARTFTLIDDAITVIRAALDDFGERLAVLENSRPAAKKTPHTEPETTP